MSRSVTSAEKGGKFLFKSTEGTCKRNRCKPKRKIVALLEVESMMMVHSRVSVMIKMKKNFVLR